MITKQLLEELFVWDRENGKFYWKTAPRTHPRLKGLEAGHEQNGYWVIKINGKNYRRGRLCFLMEHDRFPNEMVDHKNGIGTDDRICNIREATYTQNAWNHATRKKTTNLPMGIRLTKNGKYLARITANDKKYSLGAYKTIEEAVNVYQQKRRELYGEFAERPTRV
jgi:hypothetical protein